MTHAVEMINAAGKLPPRTQEFIDRVMGKIWLDHTSPRWVVSAYDAIDLIAKAVDGTDSSVP